MADIAANARRGKKATAISPIALETVKRIDALFDIERGINGQSAEERLRVRREQSAPLVAALEAWLREQRLRLSRRPRSPNPSIICCGAGIGLPSSSTMAGFAIRETAAGSHLRTAAALFGRAGVKYVTRWTFPAGATWDTNRALILGDCPMNIRRTNR